MRKKRKKFLYQRKQKTENKEKNKRTKESISYFLIFP